MVRFKNRYICFELLQEPFSDHTSSLDHPNSVQQPVPAIATSAKGIYNLLRESIKQNFGDLGAGHVLTGMQVKYFNKRTQMGIVKVPRDHCNMVLAAMVVITHATKCQCSIRVRHVSGTIKKCQQSAIRTARELIISWYEQQQLVGDSTLPHMLKESQAQISALEL
ncbi:hypothetical protein COEREDRAFT_47825 [Coemansia reversa NRRL 1564]|uniref:Ribonuclease P/MRP protein subunit POP5 n=1 Tax=Coemansia reversa (strain ATCC 12441 / NRRL 1564) TaxID=763665 RepID=A0A2G5B5H8_COERN|nr:hypothetical protein COEREDRAFT_47825 [Coemansia reversa NRRL 1564]|eukprot:PIA13977.1 hypothetical protein COEREDRAFT_47825 [Coemansia reversa NRRL 1564]